MQKIEPAVGFHVEDQVEFARVLVGEEPAALQAGGVQQDVNAAAALADLGDHPGHGFRIRQVQAEIVGCAAGCPHGINRVAGGLRALQRSQFLFHPGGCGALAAAFDACVKIAHETFFVARQPGKIGVIRIGLGHQINGLPGSQEGLRPRIQGFMIKVRHLPEHVRQYFQHPCVKYAAGT